MEKIYTFENNREEEIKVKELGLLADKIFEKIEKWDESETYFFLKKIQKKYPNCTDYRLYHLLDSSTLMERCSKFDFPGEDSIEEYIRSKNI